MGRKTPGQRETETSRRKEETERDRGKLRELELTRPVPKRLHIGLSAGGLGPYLSFPPTLIAQHVYT